MRKEMIVTARGPVEEVLQAMTLGEFCKASNQVLLIDADSRQEGYLVKLLLGKFEWVPKTAIPQDCRPKEEPLKATVSKRKRPQEEAKQMVADYFNAHVDTTDKTNITPDHVYIVWFCKTLQNWKALASTDVSDGMYYEITHNGDKNETYVDVYKKWTNYTVKRG